jgi:hypothetical protein
MPSRWLSLIRERSNSAKAPITESMRLAMGGILAGEKQALLDELHPYVLACQALARARKSSRLRASRSMLCTSTAILVN